MSSKRLALCHIRLAMMKAHREALILKALKHPRADQILSAVEEVKRLSFEDRADG